MGQITNVVLVYLLSLLSAFGSGGGAKMPHPGTPIILLSTRNATYIIPVRSNGQFKPPLASLNKIRNNGARLRSEVRERPHVYAARKPPRQAILFPMPTNTRILQAMPAGSPGSGSLLNRRPPGVQDFVFCFEAGGTEMCVRTDLTAGKVTAVARSLQEVRKRRRKALPKKKVHRRRRALRSWKDTVRDTFWPKKRESGKFGGNDEPPFMEETMDVFTFKNLTVWRRTRWEQVMNTTDLGKHANASAKLNATLREPAEKDVSVQAVKDILLLHEMLELTEWPSAKKWAEFEKGSRLLVTTQTGTNKPGRKENGWGPDLDPPYRALRVQTGIRPLARERHILEEGWGTDLDPPYGLLRVQTGMKPLARDRHVLQEGWGTDLDPPYELSRAKHEHTHPSEVESKPIPFGGRLIPPEWYEDPQPQFVIRENNGYGTKSKSKESNKLSGTMAWSNREPAEDEYVSAIPQSGSDIYTPAQQSNREAGSSVRVGHQNSAGASSSRYDHRRRKYGFGGTEQHGEWNKMSGDYAHSGKNMDDAGL
ncbi:uncharacterized protein LOC125946511 isoform X1 [Dermacentor silvarum]|uniref:uncharacterized protein LOC125946511 isoform X1 n=1 Tax=Dermacentor silvarum TaxID=543639 RepID=UPI0021018291|nr:uncharacterized protein LOC125946511 isoform X1 [Dermacentor silvarum]